MLLDKFNRPLKDLRISVIDRCNFRCPYCMPEAKYSRNYSFLKEKDWLTFDEIQFLLEVFVQLGLRKVRLTGGEPLLRPDIDCLIANIAQINQIEDIALTTNGSLLSVYAVSLKETGLKRLTVSLDSLDAKTFKEMSGGKGNLANVLDGIKAAEEAGFDSLKINVVVQRGINDHLIMDLVKYFKNTKHVIRFIEYMDVGTCNDWKVELVVPSREILARIQKEMPLSPVNPNYYGEVAKRYKFNDGQGEVGFISSVTQSFCGKCTRARLSTDGKLFTCLFAGQGVDLKTPLRQGATQEDLLEMITKIWQKREDRYSELRSTATATIKPSSKVEMFQIGG